MEKYTVVMYSSGGLAMWRKEYDKLTDAVEMYHFLNGSIVNGASLDIVIMREHGMNERIGCLFRK